MVHSLVRRGQPPVAPCALFVNASLHERFDLPLRLLDPVERTDLGEDEREKTELERRELFEERKDFLEELRETEDLERERGSRKIARPRRRLARSSASC